jgi:Lrp/AsnC family leucine-responsive transcriptional regulator
MKAKNIHRIKIETPPHLDQKDLAILRLLQSDALISTSELARQIGMSSPAVKERILRLEEDGIIAGFRVELDPKGLGYPIMAFVRIRPLPGHHAKVAELAKRISQITECHRITGEDCFLVKIHLQEISSLNEVLDQFLAHGQTTTSIVQSSPVPARSIQLPGR